MNHQATLEQLAPPDAAALSPQEIVTPAEPESRTPPSQAFFPSAEAIEREIASVLALELTSALAGWVEGYTRVGHRNAFLWKWYRQGVGVTTLSCVRPELRDIVCDTKVLGVVLDVLLDDVA